MQIFSEFHGKYKILKGIRDWKSTMLIHRKDRMKIIECLLYGNAYGILYMSLVGGVRRMFKVN